MSYRLPQSDGTTIYRHAEPKAVAKPTDHMPNVSAFLSEPKEKKPRPRKLVWDRAKSSGHLYEFLYDPETRTLRVKFKDQSEYLYESVSLRLYRGLIRESDDPNGSPGAYLHRYVVPNHACRKVRDSH